MTDTLTRALRAADQGVSLGADGMGWSPDLTLFRQAADEIDRLTAALAAASAPGVPAGWRLVPVESTLEMVDAYLKANDAYWRAADEIPPRPDVWRTGTPKEATAAGYRAMLAASPPPPTEQAEQARQPLTDAAVCPWCDRQGHDICQHADDARTCHQ